MRGRRRRQHFAANARALRPRVRSCRRQIRQSAWGGRGERDERTRLSGARGSVSHFTVGRPCEIQNAVPHYRHARVGGEADAKPPVPDSPPPAPPRPAVFPPVRRPRARDAASLIPPLPFHPRPPVEAPGTGRFRGGKRNSRSPRAATSRPDVVTQETQAESAAGGGQGTRAVSRDIFSAAACVPPAGR